MLKLKRFAKLEVVDDFWEDVGHFDTLVPSDPAFQQVSQQSFIHLSMPVGPFEPSLTSPK